MTFIAHQSRGLYSAAGVPTRHICIPFSSKTPSRVGLWVRKPVQSRIGRHSITKAHSDGGQDLAPSASRPQDAFKAAALRLQNLLNGVGDGESEMIDNLLELQPPETKLVLSLTAAAIVSSVAYFICWILGLDPLGGASLSVASLRAALVGALAAVPLVVVNFLVWADYSGSSTFVPVEEIQDAKMQTYESVIGNMSASQVAALLTAETCSSMLMALPAALGGLMLCFTSLASVAGDANMSSHFPMAAAVSVTAFMASITQAAELAVSDEEYNQIRDALDNSDRYYRVMAMGKGSGQADAAEAATAFKTVALTWLARKRVAARVAAILAGCEVAYLGVLWLQVDDLTAPVVAALIAGAVEFTFMTQRIQKKQRGTA